MITSKIFRFLGCIILSLIFNIAYNQETEIELDTLAKSYPELGVVFLSPNFINLLAGYHIKSLDIRMSGMYSRHNMNGVQLNVGYTLAEKTKSSHAISMAVGKSQDPGCDYYYAGPCYDFQRKRFFLEAGISKILHVNRGDFSDLPVWVILQIGWIYRFRNKP